MDSSYPNYRTNGSAVGLIILLGLFFVACIALVAVLFFKGNNASKPCKHMDNGSIQIVNQSIVGFTNDSELCAYNIQTKEWSPVDYAEAPPASRPATASSTQTE